MQETSFENSLLSRLTAMSPDAVVKMGRELCAALSKQTEKTGLSHGGIWPGNVLFDEDGKAQPGEPSDLPVSAMSADQVEYLAPEVFWNNLRSPAADVYSLGMLLYTGCRKGQLPFLEEDDTELARAKALRRRMKGDAIPPLTGVSEELAAVVAKALAHDASQRYASAEELLHALSETHEALPSEVPEVELSEEEAAVAAALGAGILSDEAVSAHAAKTEAEQKKQYTVRKDIESGTARRAAAKKKRSSTAIILVVGVVVVLALIGVAVAALGNLGGGEDLQEISPTLAPAATATPEPTPEPTPSPTPAPTVNPVVYTAFATEDSWTELTAAELDGGAGLRLAPITAEAEMDAAITAAKAKNLKNLWIGAQYLDENDAPNGEAGWYWTNGTLLAEDDPFWAEGQPGENPEGKKLMLCYVAPEEGAKDGEERDNWKFFAVDEANTGDYEDLGYLLTGRVTASPKPALTPSPRPTTAAQPQVTPNYEYTPVQTARPTTAPSTTAAPTPTATAAPTPTATAAPTASPSPSPSTYSVTYKADGVQVGEVQYVAPGGNATPPAVPEKTGYTGTWAHNGQNITGNLIINAVYTINKYTVTYMADGVQVGAAQTVDYGGSAVAPAVPEKAGYTGVWSADGSNITANTTITAVYTFNTGYTASGTTQSWTDLTTSAGDGDEAIDLATPSSAAELSELIKALNTHNESAAEADKILRVWLGAEYRADSDPTDSTDDAGWYWTDSENTKLAADDSNWAPGEGAKTAGKLMLVYVEDTETPANSAWKFFAADESSFSTENLGYVTESDLSAGSNPGSGDGLAILQPGDGSAAADGDPGFFDESLLRPIGGP